MKKFLAMVLAAMLLLSVGAVAVAEENVESSTGAPNFTKKLTVVNDGTTVDNVTFSFTATFTEYKPDNKEGTEADSSVSGPELTLSDVTLSSNTTSGTVTITHQQNFPKVGVYTYNVIETAATVAGIVNTNKTMLLKVTVINGTNGLEEKYALYQGDDKSREVENKYQAGSLSISKTVKGGMGDTTEYFEFKVILNGEKGKTYADSFTVTGGSYTSNPTSVKINEEKTFYLKHDETFTIKNIPYNVTYTVTETNENKNNYTTEKNNESGTISRASVTADFTNTREGSNPDMGITTDSLPYVMLLGFVLLAGAALLMKRRMAH